MHFRIVLNAVVFLGCIAAGVATAWKYGVLSPWPMAVWAVLLIASYATGLLKYIDPPPSPPRTPLGDSDKSE